MKIKRYLSDEIALMARRNLPVRTIVSVLFFSCANVNPAQSEAICGIKLTNATTIRVSNVCLKKPVTIEELKFIFSDKPNNYKICKYNGIQYFIGIRKKPFHAVRVYDFTSPATVPCLNPV